MVYVVKVISPTLKKKMKVKVAYKEVFTTWVGFQGVSKFFKEVSYGWAWTQIMDYVGWTKNTTRVEAVVAGKFCGLGLDLYIIFLRK